MWVYIAVIIFFIGLLLISGIVDYHVKMQKQYRKSDNQQDYDSYKTSNRKPLSQNTKKPFNIDDDDAFARYDSTATNDAIEKKFWQDYDFDLDEYLEKEKKKRNR